MMRRFLLVLALLATGVATAVADAPGDQHPRVMRGATTLHRVNGASYADLYPARALAEGVGGEVVLDCVVAADGKLGCTVLSEAPEGYGFGEASVTVAQDFRISARTASGQSTAGGRVRVPLTWRLD